VYYVHVIRFSDPLVFRARAAAFLLADDVENNLLLSIAAVTPLPAHGYLALVEDGGSIVGCAVRTPPRRAVISRAPTAALESLAADLAAMYPDLSEVLGPEPDVATFADVWARRTSVPSIQGTRQGLFDIRVAPQLHAQTPGTFRVASERDMATVVAWCSAFVAEALPGEPINPEAQAAARIAERSLFIWDNGEPVSMAAWAGETAGGVRITFVYTPFQHRRRGYAAACVTRLTRLLMEQGRPFCCLYADLANPTATGVYQRIGYRRVSEWSHYVLNSRKAGTIR
jgi:uncharacterized protein